MKNLPTLDAIVLDTLDFYENQENLPMLDVEKFHFPLVLGSGNAIETGKIVFRKNPALFASESDASDKIALEAVKEVVIISASGEKHAPILTQSAKEAHKKTFLISSKVGSTASKIADESLIFPKIPEPYTYNTSTYFGWIYGSEMGKYQPKSVKNFIENEIEKILKNFDFSQYKAFFVLIPNEFALLKNMIETKFIELFGRQIPRDIATFDQFKHAMSVVPTEGELFIVFGNSEKKIFGENQLDLPIFDRENYGPMMMISYFVVGKIQVNLPDFFRENIANYCEKSEYNITPMVE